MGAHAKYSRDSWARRPLERIRLDLITVSRTEAIQLSSHYLAVITSFCFLLGYARFWLADHFVRPCLPGNSRCAREGRDMTLGQSAGQRSRHLEGPLKLKQLATIYLAENCMIYR